MMDPAHLLHPTAGGLVCAVGAVVAGAPVFSEGLKSLRLCRHLAGLREQPVADGLTGFVHVSGTVALDSPFFTPLSSRPCAAYQLEAHAPGGPAARGIEERREFRAVGPGGSVRVSSTRGRWDLPVTAERAVAADEPLSQNVEALIRHIPEASWWRRMGGQLVLVERSLPAGSPCHVVGFARPAQPMALPGGEERLRTGTDDDWVAAGADLAPAPPEVCLAPGEFLDFLLVSDRAPGARDLIGLRWRALGAFVGPALSLSGLLYLASAAESLRARAYFQ